MHNMKNIFVTFMAFQKKIMPRYGFASKVNVSLMNMSYELDGFRPAHNSVHGECVAMNRGARPDRD